MSAGASAVATEVVCQTHPRLRCWSPLSLLAHLNVHQLLALQQDQHVAAAGVDAALAAGIAAGTAAVVAAGTAAAVAYDIVLAAAVVAILLGATGRHVWTYRTTLRPH